MKEKVSLGSGFIFILNFLLVDIILFLSPGYRRHEGRNFLFVLFTAVCFVLGPRTVFGIQQILVN